MDARVILTVLADVVVLEIVAEQRLVLNHAELKSFDNVSSVIELIVGDEDLLKALGDAGTHEDALDALVSQKVTREVDLFECRPCIDQNLKERLRCLMVDATVAERQRFQNRVDGQALSKEVDAFAAKVVVVKFQDQNRRLHLRVQDSGEELAAETRDLVVEKFEDLDF